MNIYGLGWQKWVINSIYDYDGWLIKGSKKC